MELISIIFPLYQDNIKDDTRTPPRLKDFARDIAVLVPVRCKYMPESFT
jgi:hypothetical protein